MKIGVISDTHGSLRAWQKVMKEYFNDVDMIIHAGDLFDDFNERKYAGQLADEMSGLKIPFIAAKGNCDSEEDLSLAAFPVAAPYAFVQIDSTRIIVNHGKKLTEEDKFKLAGKWKVDIFISGHTHIPELKKKKEVILLNPGSPSMGKKEQSAGMIESTGNKFDIKIFNTETGEILYHI